MDKIKRRMLKIVKNPKNKIVIKKVPMVELFTGIPNRGEPSIFAG